MSKSNVIMLTGNIIMSVFKMTYVTYSGTDIKQLVVNRRLPVSDLWAVIISGVNKPTQTSIGHNLQINFRMGVPNGSGLKIHVPLYIHLFQL